jgi:hypothetical protein
MVFSASLLFTVVPGLERLAERAQERAAVVAGGGRRADERVLLLFPLEGVCRREGGLSFSLLRTSFARAADTAGAGEGGRHCRWAEGTGKERVQWGTRTKGEG